MKDKNSIYEKIRDAEQELAALDAKRTALKVRIEQLQSQKQSIADEQLPFDQSSKSNVTNDSTQEEKIALFRSLFRGRKDVYPKRFESKRSGKSGYQTGMRMGELLGLKWSYVDLENNFFRLPPELTKESKPKIIPFNYHVAEVLSTVPRAIHHDYVFTYRGNAFSEGGIRRSFRTACINAGVPFGRKTQNGITFHDIRRTVKTHLLYAGVDKVRRDAIVGHSLKGMDVHYIVLSDESLRAAMDQYTKWLDEQIEAADRLLKNASNENKINSK